MSGRPDITGREEYVHAARDHLASLEGFLHHHAMPGLQWCHHCDRIWLNPFWQVQTESEIPRECTVCGRDVRAQLCHSTQDGLRTTLRAWSEARHQAQTVSYLLGRYDSALAYATRKGQDGAPDGGRERRRGRRRRRSRKQKSRQAGRANRSLQLEPATVSRDEAMRAWNEAKAIARSSHEEAQARKRERAEHEAELALRAEEDRAVAREKWEAFVAVQLPAQRAELGVLLATLYAHRARFILQARSACRDLVSSLSGEGARSQLDPDTRFRSCEMP